MTQMTDDYSRFQQILRAVAKGKKGSRDMTREEAAFCLNYLMSEKMHPVQFGALATAMRFKGTTETELMGFIDAVENHSAVVNAKMDVLCPNSPYDGRKVSLNLSVAASLVCAAAGASVLLHSSTGLPPKKGVTPAHVLEYLGIPALLDVDTAAEQLNQNNFAFIHASEFSFGIEKLRPLREVLLYRSFLHTLEVLNDPGRAKYRIIGVAHDHLMSKFAKTAAARGATRVLAVPGLDGADELPMQKAQAYEIIDGKERLIELDPQEYGFSYSEKIPPANAAQTAKMTEAILNNENTNYTNNVLYNAAVRLYICGSNSDPVAGIKEGVKKAREAVESGKTKGLLEKLRGARWS